MKLIDKDKVAAEIEKRFDEYTSSILKHYDAYKEAKAQELVAVAKEKGTPALKKAANDVLDNVIKVSKDAQKRLAEKK